MRHNAEILIWLFIIFFFALATVLLWMMITAPPTHANDKYDGDCPIVAIVGRCADKCPTGEYQQGIDKNTGASICRIEPKPVTQIMPLTTDNNFEGK